MIESPQLAVPSEQRQATPVLWIRRCIQWFRTVSAGEFVILFAVTAFLLFYGLVPVFGGDQLGLVGADEPRYAQIAREMLNAHSEVCQELHTSMVPSSLSPHAVTNALRCVEGGTVTPILYGHPWLEKPALYYWRAMSFFKEFGVSDWSARLPSSSGAFVLIVLIFLHMRRFRPGGQLDAALITASSVAIIGFARGASTDMQLAAPFCIGMLGWYAWYETGKKFWLFDLYFFGAAATLAKGPVAPFMALGIICLFLGLRREWSVLRRTVWIPGLLLYLAMVLPWYIEVQRKNPTFLREFILQHNLKRFATDIYQHTQPVWYYIPVLLIGLLPWAGIAIRALVDAFQNCLAEWRVSLDPRRYLGHGRTGDAFPEFLVLWALFPIVFFSFSKSKLPGYILPSIPPITILTGDYLNRTRREGLPAWLLWAHAATCGVMIFVLVLAPQHMVYETLIPSAGWLLTATLAAMLVTFAIVRTIRIGGSRWIRSATLFPVMAALVFLLGFHGRELDRNYSARPLAQEMERLAPDTRLVVVHNVKRDMVYGLAFYRNQEPLSYDRTGIPPGQHLLVIRTSEINQLPELLPGRVYEPLFLYDTQGLAVYKVLPIG
ncbi:MAG: glycosyltransferase family 39 protein [Acidobacteriota bacterium]|nr:glycosyltransferase family 39 protein [Acidobacteriota bacterium]